MKQSTSTKRIIFTLLFLSGGLLNTSGILDQTGKNYIDAAFKRSVFSFAMARGLNAVLSVAQGTEMSIEPLGVGLTLTPGEILDPVNDLIERFSWIMLASSTSIGIQEIFLEISTWTVFSYLINTVFALTIVVLWWPKCAIGGTNNIIKVAILLMFLRFSVPIVFIMNELTYQEFLAANYQQSTQSIVRANSELNELTTEIKASANEPAIDEESQPVWETLEDIFNVKAKVVAGISQVKEKMQVFEQIAADTTTYILNLIVIFILQSIIFPILFLYGLYKIMVLLIKYQFQ